MVDARELLEAEREAALRRLALLRREHEGVVGAAQNSNGDDEHDPEGATIAYERSQVETLINQTRNSLAEIQAALDRVAEGTYGQCETCGEAIPAARLEVRPLARTCVDCATALR